MDRCYRAIIRDTGEILECDSFKSIYRHGLMHGKDYLRFEAGEDQLSTVIELERVTYCDYEYINRYGYPQRDIVDREHIAYIAISEVGYTIDYRNGSFDVDRGCY